VSQRRPVRIPILDAISNQLTAPKAFYYFVAAYGVGALLLSAPFGIMPLLVVIPIGVYTLILLYAQTALYTRLNVTLKDSPYFLGFLLTLTGLVKIFWGLQAATGAPVTPGRIVKDAAGAIIATLMGLLGRQMAHSFDPGDEAREALFEGLADELRDQADKLRSAQRRFSDLLAEFTAAKELQFAREERAMEKWVGHVERTSLGLEQLAISYQPTVAKLLGDSTALANSFAAARQQIEQDFQSLQAGLRANVEQVGTAFRSAVTAHLESFAGARESLQHGLTGITNVAVSASSTIGQHADLVKTATVGITQSYERMAGAAGAAENAAASAATAFASMANQVDESATQMADNIKNAGVETREGFKLQVKGIADDVQAIDHLLTSITSLLRERYKLPPVDSRHTASE
jgi:hypothetical protein